MKFGDDVPATLREALGREGLDTVEGAMTYDGGQDMIKPNLLHRRRTELTVTDAQGKCWPLYMKRYAREALAARLQRWWTHGIRTSAAGVEFDNIQALRKAGLPTMDAVICGEQSGRPDARWSYLIVTAVPGRKLEQWGRDFLHRNADRPDVLAEFTIAMAELVAKLHRGGWAHRDMYWSHVFLDETDGRMDLYLIDLARVFAPRWRRTRWFIKDLAQMKYSAASEWVSKYWPLFMGHYLGQASRTRTWVWNRRIDLKVALMRLRGRRLKRGRR